MSAAEKLRALEVGTTAGPWHERSVIDRLVYVELADGRLIAALRNALPQIVAVVEAAEDIERRYLEADPMIGGLIEDSMAALAALDEALT